MSAINANFDATPVEPQRLTAAAEHFYTQFLARFSTIDDVKPETVIACTARMAGTMLFRSFAPAGRHFEPGITVLSDEANEKGPRLMNIMFVTLRAAGHPLAEQDLDNNDATTEAAELSLRETQTLLDEVVRAYCESSGLTFEDAAHALAVATALFVHDCRTMLDVRKGAAIAVYGFVEGCKTAPIPFAKARASAPSSAWQVAPAPIAQVSASAPAPAVAPVAPPSLLKYVLIFAAWYIGGMALAGVALSAFGVRGTGVNTGIFIGATFAVCIQFVTRLRRLWLPGEKWRLIFGFLLASLAYDLPVAWLATAGRAPFGAVLAATAFVGLLRLLVLWLLLGPGSRALFGRYATSS